MGLKHSILVSSLGWGTTLVEMILDFRLFVKSTAEGVEMLTDNLEPFTQLLLL
jgi:hypothetical protein